jgi:hypothetical protein
VAGRTKLAHGRQERQGSRRAAKTAPPPSRGRANHDHLVLELPAPQEPTSGPEQQHQCAFEPAQILNPGKVFPKLHRCAELGRLHVHRGQVRFPDLPRF